MAACAGIVWDCAEDSEPERKRIRVQAVETRKRRSRHKQLEHQRETTVTIVARGSSPFSQTPVDDNTIGHGYCFLRSIRVT